MTNDIQVRPDGINWLAMFEAWQANFDRPLTSENYLHVWKDFLSFIQIDDPASVTSGDVSEYRNDLEKRGLSNTSINLYLSAISSFYRYVIDHSAGVWSFNPAVGVKRKKVNPYGKATPLNLKVRQDELLLQTIDRSTLKGKRDYAIILLFLTTGVRVSAIATATFADIENKAGVRTLRYTNKGGDPETAVIQPVVWKAITTYLDAHGGGSNADDPVFRSVALSDTNTPLTRHAIARMVKRYCDKAFGEGHGITPHSLRHTAALALIPHATLPEISKFLKHKDLRITSIYLDHMAANEADEKLSGKLADRYED